MWCNQRLEEIPFALKLVCLVFFLSHYLYVDFDDDCYNSPVTEELGALFFIAM